MKKVNFYWIIVALVVLNLNNTGIAMHPVSEEMKTSHTLNINTAKELSTGLIADAGASGRWMR